MLKRILTAAVAAVALVATVSIATPAQAYPAGNSMAVTLSTSTPMPKTKFTATATKVYPGCSVTFALKSRDLVTSYGTATGTANGSGTTNAVTLTAPGTAGYYTVVATAASTCRSVESASANLTSGRITTTTCVLSSTSLSAAAKPTFTIAGVRLWGSTGVPSTTATIVLNSSKGKVATVKATTSATGNFSTTVKPKTYVLGAYAATCTFASDATYIGIAANSNSLTIVR